MIGILNVIQGDKFIPMNTPVNDSENINGNEDELTAESADVNETSSRADDGFKTGNKTNGLTWEQPMDEQAFDDKSLSEDPEDEEGD